MPDFYKKSLEITKNILIVIVMSAKLNSLIANLQAKVDALTDTDTRLDADFALENYAGAALAYHNGAERGPVQYSIASRSFSFESKEAARQAMLTARMDLDNLLSAYGGSTLVDMGGQLWA